MLGMLYVDIDCGLVIAVIAKVFTEMINEFFLVKRGLIIDSNIERVLGQL